MLKSRRVRKAQVALEVLFITAIILAGVFLIVPSYVDNSRTATLIAEIKNSAASACSYLNTGVIVSDPKYSSLNPIISASNYSYRYFLVDSIRSNESGNVILVNVNIHYSGKIDLSESEISSAIRDFIMQDLVLHTNSKLTESGLYYKGKKVIITVSVVRE